MPPIPPITQFLMLACTAVYCLQMLAPVSIGYWFALVPINSGSFWPWQLITYAFLHGDALHLFFNMWGLWMFGSELERLWGQRRYIVFLAVAILTAAVAFLALTALTNTPSGVVGFSGALYGLLIATAMLFPDRTIMPLFPPIPMKMKVFVAVFGAIELLLGVVATGDGIAHFAHLGGMLGGFLMMRYWRGQAPFGRRRR